MILIDTVLPSLLLRLGFVLDEHQPHVGGERSVIGGSKYVLLGRRSADMMRVVIKASNQAEGRYELDREHACREVLHRIRFAYQVFFSPAQVGWYDIDGYRISITAFLDQERAFLERPLTEQFFFAMKAFETQESAHAATFEQARVITGAFGMYTTKTYVSIFEARQQEITTMVGHRVEMQTLLKQAGAVVKNHAHRIEQYGGFLTHADFVPHNIRIVGHDIYLLDHSSLRFGNKYDGWARFLNFMLLHHSALEQALVMYVRENRAKEEYEALYAMRIWRFEEIIHYYITHLGGTVGNMHELYQARIDFWSDMLRSALEGVTPPPDRIQAYISARDRLRTDEEKQRQQGLH